MNNLGPVLKKLTFLFHLKMTHVPKTWRAEWFSSSIWEMIVDWRTLCLCPGWSSCCIKNVCYCLEFTRATSTTQNQVISNELLTTQYLSWDISAHNEKKQYQKQKLSKSSLFLFVSLEYKRVLCWLKSVQMIWKKKREATQQTRFVTKFLEDGWYSLLHLHGCIMREILCDEFQWVHPILLSFEKNGTCLTCSSVVWSSCIYLFVEIQNWSI